MNPFNPGDHVKCPSKCRKNGTVVYILCNECDSCKIRRYNDCSSNIENKNWVIVSFPNPTNGCIKRFKYKKEELELDFDNELEINSHSSNIESGNYKIDTTLANESRDLSHKDIKQLGVVKIDIPLITDYNQLEEEQFECNNDFPNLKSEIVKNDGKIMMGMFFDNFVAPHVKY